MLKIHLLLAVLLITNALWAQQQPDFNLELVGTLDYPEEENDIWGFVDRNGVEYAVLGTRKATSVISLANPSLPEEVMYVPGDSTLWRDMKSWDNYIFSVCDRCDDGLVIIDMTEPEAPVASEISIFEDVIRDDMTAMRGGFHNIYIDERGYLYASGGGLNNGGIVVLDVASHPTQPRIIGYGPREYCHDMYVRNGLVYAAEIEVGHMAVYNVQDPANFVLLGTQQTTSQFTHNTWLSDDSNVVFTTDERGRGAVDAYDVSDPSDIKLLDSYRPFATLSFPVIPHNVHVYNDFLVTSYYTDGLKIIDAQYPDNLIEVASYDTWSGADEGFNGCWGAYPFLPSGLVLASDIERGLFVLQPDYQRAGYVQGRVTNVEDGVPIVGVDVNVQAIASNATRTAINGSYKAGGLSDTSLLVVFSHPAFHDTSLVIEVASDEVRTLDVALRPLESTMAVEVMVVDAHGEVVPSASVRLRQSRVIEQRTGADGVALIFSEEDDFVLSAGRWGYGDTTVMIDAYNGPVTLGLPGDGSYYRDRFETDQGWRPSFLPSAEEGGWVITPPQGSRTDDDLPFSPDFDSPNDSGSGLAITGALPDQGMGATTFDATFNSPFIPMSDGVEAVKLSFDYWLMTSAIPPDDEAVFFNVSVDNQDGDREFITRLEGRVGEWRHFDTIDIRPILDNFDELDSFSIVLRPWNQTRRFGFFTDMKAGADNFHVTLERATSTEALPLPSPLDVWPNPSDGKTYVRSRSRMQDARLYTLDGRLVSDHDIGSEETIIQLPYLPGLYVLQVRMADGSVQHTKVMRL